MLVFNNQEPFEEKNRRYFDFQRRSGQLPVQKEVWLCSLVLILTKNFFQGFGTNSSLMFLIQGEEVDYRGVLHRDGSVLMSISVDQLQVSCNLLFSFFDNSICQVQKHFWISLLLFLVS